ncbi:chemotaxis protein CheX [Aquabacterium sp. G14]|uniref:chemotaxis protein CheX n=1 Tax=Aquabacterium sp. G14 TaxID=3130164 RepID=UPI00309E4C6C
MQEAAQLVSKVLVLNDDAEVRGHIKAFCDAHHLIPVKPQAGAALSVLKSNVDLGAIFMQETYTGEGGNALELARAIHAIRPELPIFLRREAASHLDDLPDLYRGIFTAAYTTSTIDELAPLIDKNIFSFQYPNALVRGITEITKTTLETQFKGVEVRTEAPYMVRDRIIYGELFTLIPLESTWCRGYMMLQTEEGPLIKYVEDGRTHISRDPANFRDINHVMGEVTNLIWGAFKNRFISNEPVDWRQSQVPLIVNHEHRYISFGSEDPQLCFRYTLVDPNGEATPLVLYQRFVFNLSWAPEKFKENEVLTEDLFESGELELF